MYNLLNVQLMSSNVRIIIKNNQLQLDIKINT